MNLRILSRLTATVLLFLMLASCGPAASIPTTPGAVTSTPLSVPEGYPAAPTQPAAPTMAADYPAPPTMMPATDPYPGGLVWILRPVGVQCEDGTAPGYGDLQEAVATLTAAGVAVKEAQMTDLMVMAVCGGPTSAHYRLQIDAADLQTAESLGWTQE